MEQDNKTANVGYFSVIRLQQIQHNPTNLLSKRRRKSIVKIFLVQLAMSQSVSVSELFGEYEADFERLCHEANEFLESAKSESSGRSKQLATAERRLVEAEQALKQMELEARAMPPETRQKLQEKIKSHRQRIAERRKEKDAINRSALFGEVVGKTADEHGRAEDMNESMLEASRKLAEAKRTVLDSEQIGIDVMGDLRLQREVIVRSRDNMGKAGQNYSMAGKTLEGTLQRADQNRKMVCFIAGLMLVMLIIAFYFLATGG